MEYIEPMLTCDKILDLFKGNVAMESHAIYNSFDKDSSTRDLVTTALSKLVTDKHLFKRDSFYQREGDALIFIKNGKYFGLVYRESNREEKEKRNEELKSILDAHTLEVGNSVIATNKIVKENTKKQENLTKVALWIAAISLLISIGQFAKEFLSKNDKQPPVELKETDSILRNTGQRIDNVNQTLQKIDSTLKNHPKK